MIQGFLGMLGVGMVLTFIGCCVASAALQIVAWTRHAREGAPVTVRALWRPEEHFDPIGIQQIRLARTLLTMGGVAYLSFGVLSLLARVLQ
ncbi:MAG TPA: hypothetical protein VHG28_04730 [Longimicrobiaceae bacterium]|nr:hypothetical protein [Longimicrobiaceae bacterium]